MVHVSSHSEICNCCHVFWSILTAKPSCKLEESATSKRPSTGTVTSECRLNNSSRRSLLILQLSLHPRPQHHAANACWATVTQLTWPDPLTCHWQQHTCSRWAFDRCYEAVDQHQGALHETSHPIGWANTTPPRSDQSQAFSQRWAAVTMPCHLVPSTSSELLVQAYDSQTMIVSLKYMAPV